MFAVCCSLFAVCCLLFHVCDVMFVGFVFACFADLLLCCVAVLRFFVVLL